MKRLTSTLLVAAVVLAAGAARAQEKRTLTDKEFVPRAIAYSTALNKFSDLANKNAANKDVKEFAATLTNDSKAMTDELMNHAKGLKVAVVAGLEKDHRPVLAKLLTKKGANFDKEYTQQVVKDLEATVGAFEGVEGTTNEELRKYVKKTLPTLRKHLKTARSLADKVKDS
jgi:putative membrane protein